MGVENFMRQGPDGRVSIMLNNLPSHGFIDAYKTKNICKAKILNRFEKQGITAI